MNTLAFFLYLRMKRLGMVALLVYECADSAYPENWSKPGVALDFVAKV